MIEKKEKYVNPYADETKNEKFLRVANPRIKKLISQFRLLTKMVRSSAYEVTDENHGKIIDAIGTEFETLQLASRKKVTEIEDIL